MEKRSVGRTIWIENLLGRCYQRHKTLLPSVSLLSFALQLVHSVHSTEQMDPQKKEESFNVPKIAKPLERYDEKEKERV